MYVNSELRLGFLFISKNLDQKNRLETTHFYSRIRRSIFWIIQLKVPAPPPQEISHLTRLIGDLELKGVEIA